MGLCKQQHWQNTKSKEQLQLSSLTIYMCQRAKQKGYSIGMKTDKKEHRGKDVRDLGRLSFMYKECSKKERQSTSVVA
jgi:hypothetical protein